MAIDDFSRVRLEQMIDLRRPLAVLGRRLPWMQIEAALVPGPVQKNEVSDRTRQHAGNCRWRQ